MESCSCSESPRESTIFHEFNCDREREFDKFDNQLMGYISRDFPSGFIPLASFLSGFSESVFVFSDVKNRPEKKNLSIILPPSRKCPRSSRAPNRASGTAFLLWIGKFFERSFPFSCCAVVVVCVGMRSRRRLEPRALFARASRAIGMQNEYYRDVESAMPSSIDARLALLAFFHFLNAAELSRKGVGGREGGRGSLDRRVIADRSFSGTSSPNIVIRLDDRGMCAGSRWLTVPPLLPRVPVRCLFLTDARRRSPGDRNGKRARGTRGHFFLLAGIDDRARQPRSLRSFFAAFVEERSESSQWKRDGSLRRRLVKKNTFDTQRLYFE